MFGQSESGNRAVGQARFLVETKLVRAARRPTRSGHWESGNTAGNIGLLPFLTRTAGRLPCCLARTAARRAHLRSHSGRNAGAALACCPTCPEFTTPPHLFRTLICERLCLPLQMTEGLCQGCHAQLDVLGRHQASCARSGRVKKRATPTERRGWCDGPTERVLEGHERRCQCR